MDPITLNADLKQSLLKLIEDHSNKAGITTTATTRDILVQLMHICHEKKWHFNDAIFASGEIFREELVLNELVEFPNYSVLKAVMLSGPPDSFFSANMPPS